MQFLILFMWTHYIVICSVLVYHGRVNAYINSEDIENDSSEILNIRIPWPSGVIVDRMTDVEGNIYRFGRLQRNAIRMRPLWQQNYVVENVFSRYECIDMISEAESYANAFGWNKGRHVDYDIRPTKDLMITTIYKNKQEELNSIYLRFYDTIFTTISNKYNMHITRLRISDLFITKYNASTPERLLGPHQDKSIWSFVITLNDNFTGGGTYFFDTRTLWKPPVGGALVFNGYQMHGGSPITSGMRYIVAGFVDYGDDSFEEFIDGYDPIYDGYAAQSGFHSGDLIIGIEVCRLATICENIPDNTCKAGETVHRYNQDISQTTTDEEWIDYAQSCEKFAPGTETVIKVRRRIKNDSFSVQNNSEL